MSQGTRMRFVRSQVLTPWLALAAWGLGQPVTHGAGWNLTPARLRCEYSRDPLGVDDPHPRLSWTVESEARGQRQTAYRILVASTSDTLGRDQGDLWDTGRVTSDETVHIAYTGRELASSQQVLWKVRVWDQSGAASEWSAPARWTMGLFKHADWNAVWIGATSATETLLLRQEFDARAQLVRALAHVSGLGHYELTLNGARPDDELLAPGWTDYTNTTLYDTKDVTALVRPGRNAVGIALGNGMYNVVRRHRFAKFAGSFGPLRAILHLRLEYADGTVDTVTTDDSWRWQAGPVVYSSVYGGEDYDARLAAGGWDRPGFDDSGWRRAVRMTGIPKNLRGHSAAAEPLRPIEARRPVAERPLAEPGLSVYDLGQNASYMPRLRVSGPAGSVVRLTPAELVNDDGTLYRGTVAGTHRGTMWWEYTKGTDGEEEWFPQFFYAGGRYLEARRAPATPGGWLPEITSLEGVVVHSSAEPSGDFACSNELLNRIRQLVRWAQRSNMVSVLTDCPHREKLGWLEAHHLNGPALRYEFDLARLFAKGMRDMAEAQLADGLVPNIAPEYTQFEQPFRASTEWGSAFIIVPWQQYQFTGDIALLRTHYAAMKRYFAYLERRAEDDVVSEGLGDWFDLGPRKPGHAQLTPPVVTATAFYYHDAWILAQVAALVGQPDEARDYAARAARIRASCQRRFFNKETGSYATGSQCANALALVFGLVEAEDRGAVFASLARDVEGRGYAITTGDVGFRFLLLALAQGGRSDLIYRFVNQDETPGYGYQLKKGATALSESWDANRDSSHNHFMLGQVTEWLYKYLAGIDTDPDAPGFKKIVIDPQPVGDLAWARARYDSVHGPISSHWTREGERFTLKIHIPANTTATVRVPARTADGVREGGRPAQRAKGVRLVGLADGRVVFAVQSGDYSFASTLSRVE